MSKGFLVFSAKNVIVSLLMISFLIMLCISGTRIVNKTIETVMSDKLLPIYSVETPEKKVAITFDCAWSWSQ